MRGLPVTLTPQWKFRAQCRYRNNPLLSLTHTLSFADLASAGHAEECSTPTYLPWEVKAAGGEGGESGKRRWRGGSFSLRGDTNGNSSSEVTVERHERNVGWEEKLERFQREFAASGDLPRAGNKPLPVGGGVHFKMVKLSMLQAVFIELNLKLSDHIILNH